MKRNLVILILSTLPLINSCRKDFLDIKPRGNLDENILLNENGINALLIGAYSMLDGVSSQYGWESASSNWLYGDVRGLLGNIGSDSGGSGDEWPIKVYRETADNSWLYVKWKEVYDAVSRCNSVILESNLALNKGKITKEQSELFIKQARTLRGWYHFEAWRMWEKIAYVDENTIIDSITNKIDFRDKIIADLQEGISLPGNMGQIGRFNSTVSKVLLAKAKMQMYHDYSGALVLLLEAKNGTKPNGAPIGLASTYGEIFDIENRNGIESVYTVQYSVNDGSMGYNGGWGESLNFPYKTGGGAPAGCCGFFQPTQEFVNSFRTSGGLPMLDFSYNTSADLRDQGIPSGPVWSAANSDGTPKVYYQGAVVTAYESSKPYIDRAYVSLITNNSGNDPLNSPGAWKLLWTEDNSMPVDPRLDWSVGRRGIPYWDWGIHTGSDWIRDQTYAGPYSPKKQVYKKSQEGKYTEVGNWTSGFTANGYRMIRYADILLLIAECQIETGDIEGARQNINLIRARAANPAGFVKEADGVTPAANYVVSLYPAFTDAEQARLALRMERKLELGMEGHRWFDINRWGITIDELNRILEYEGKTPWGSAMYGGALVGPEDITYPIPQRAIDTGHKRIIQNR